MHQVHNKCQLSLVAKSNDFSNKDQHIKYLQDRLHEYEQNIQKIEIISEEVVKTWIAQSSVRNSLLEDLYRLTLVKVTNVETRLVVHEVTMRLLEPIDYHTITGEANAWGKYISKMANPT